MKMTKSELREMIREVLKEELASRKQIIESANQVPHVAYVMVIPNHHPMQPECEYITFSNRHDGYIVVDDVNEIADGSYSTDMAYITDIAADARDELFGEMWIAKVLNFNSAYNDAEEPEIEYIEEVK